METGQKIASESSPWNDNSQKNKNTKPSHKPRGEVTNEKAPQTKTKSLADFSYDDVLKKLFVAADLITLRLAENCRKLMDLEENEPFPEERATQVREAIISGLADWAVRRMGTDLDKYLDEGVRNFLDLFWLGASNPYQDRPWGKGERFSG